MKRKFNFWFLTIGVVALSACSSDNNLYDPAKAAARIEAQYEAAFVKKYGTIAVDQDWGFGAAKADAANTRAFDANSNLWGDYVDVPSPVSDTEKAKVVEWFKTHRNPVSIPINWTDFFIQQVYKGEDVYTAKDNNTKFKGSDRMNRLLVGISDEHANNFNNGDCSETNVNNQYQDKITFMVNSNTERFGYSNSAVGTKPYYDFTIQEIDGAYYVGFDFSANGQNPNEQVEADGYYSDWIVKISPATYKNAQRIIAEDLGESDDFDFNDVVFDVATNGGSTIVTLQAAGGTIPLYIQVGNDQREVHQLFDVPVTTMVNTGALAKAPVMYRVAGTGSIEILVESQTAGIYKLKGDIGKAPQKIAVPTTYQWTKERESIETKYPKFSSWVGNTEIDWIE